MIDAKALPGFTERFADVKACRMRYFVGGRGDEALVLVHGLGGGASNWVALAPILARRRRVLVPELPGHGATSPLALVAELEGFAPATFVGHSLGALVALRLAIRHPDAASGIVLAGAAGISSTARRAKLALELLGIVHPSRWFARFRGEIARYPRLRYLPFGHWLTADPAALSPEVVEGFLGPPALHADTVSAARAMVFDDPRTDLEHLRCPALVLWGARDNQLPVEDAFDYARRLGAPLRLIADCGHLLIGEKPEVCAEAIEAFLAANEGRAGETK